MIFRVFLALIFSMTSPLFSSNINTPYIFSSYSEDPLNSYLDELLQRTDNDFDDLFPDLADIENSYEDIDSSALFKTETKTLENNNPYITEEMWEAVRPYLMPDNHPIKAKLDLIFSESRATINSETMVQAGFFQCAPRAHSHCVVTRHKKVKGYFFKLYFDSQIGEEDWAELSERAAGAVSIAEAIYRFGYKKYFKVPRKWIYVLPENPSPPPEMERKNFILIAEDMDILSDEKNRKKWKSESFGEDRLLAFYMIIKDQGLHDSLYPFNVPFSKDGKIAFIDTEQHHYFNINYHKLLKYLNDKYKPIWLKIIGE